MLLTLALTVALEIKPSFHLPQAAWRASQVVVVDEGDLLDGEVTIAEVWRGDLEVGASLSIPALGDYAAEDLRAANDIFGVNPNVVVDGRHVVLFLMDGAVGAEIVGGMRATRLRLGGPRGVAQLDESLAPITTGEGDTLRKLYPCTAFGGWSVSMAWIHDGAVYANVQRINPGPSDLGFVAKSTKMFQGEVLARSASHAAFRFALAGETPEAVCRSLTDLAIADTDRATERIDLLYALEQRGPLAVPFLERIAPIDIAAVDVLGRMGEAGGEALLRLLAIEIEYWTVQTVNLGEPDPDMESRAYVGVALAQALRRNHAQGGLEQLRALVAAMKPHDATIGQPRLDALMKVLVALGQR